MRAEPPPPPPPSSSSNAAPHASSLSAAGARLHSTVRLNQFTLRFEDAALERAYQASSHQRKKALWLRSLVPAAASHLLFGLGDSIEHPPANLQVTLPARVFLAVLQLAMFVLVKWDLIQAHETTMLLVSVCNGVPSLLIYALQRPSLHQWDALFVIFGLSFYTIPKITPLGFIASTGGSWATAALYAALSFVVRPPARRAEAVLGFLYCAPVVGIFNTIAYYSEYNSRERFVLRRRLSSESITLAVARTNTLAPPASARTNQIFQTLAHSNGPTFGVGLLLWGAFTTGGWASLPDALKFVDQDTGWAWFSHCAGVTVFLLVVTRQLKWLFVVPLIGALVLWMLSLTLPSAWIIVSAHSVGYGLLVASVVVAMGVFSWFVCAWRELVSFLTRSCFLYPQLQVGLESEYPLLVKIVSEYTAGFDPAILSSRLPARRAIGPAADALAGHGGAFQSATSPRRRHPVVRAKLLATGAGDSGGDSYAPRGKAGEFADDAEIELSRPEELVAAVAGADSARMVSVLPSFKAGKCFFCSKNDAEHFVPACGMWGKWTHWRMTSQQLGAAAGTLRAKPIVSMCTSYYDIQNRKAELEGRAAQLEATNRSLLARVQQLRAAESAAAAATVQLQSEVRALDDKLALELQRRDAHWQQKTKALLEDANRLAHERKLELRRAHAAHDALRVQASDAQRRAELADARASDAQQTSELQARQLADLQQELAQVRAQLEAPTYSKVTSSSSSNSSMRLLEGSSASLGPSLQALQPAKRLPYAQFLEIEGLRESSRKRDGATDYSASWRLALNNSDPAPPRRRES
ncbi:hypothetical protein PybrP1_002441 [[Pythium] brassicae (nom. inval.)]|nr:hypothetical protein PybrP1_002441 [[Pythium] brassicae (nom. inval.)]